MTQQKKTLPRGWDPALEELLAAPIKRAERLSNIGWSERNMTKILDTKTLIEAINVRSVKEESVTTWVDPLKARASRINHLINMPLSPRKPIVIPCSCAAVKQRDKQKIEKIIRQRNRVSNNEMFEIMKRDTATATTSHTNSGLTRRFPAGLNTRCSALATRHKSFFD
ncbi:hypothetical protein TRFO_17769 [Tritrichomonas foetus]|uniref:Uncharacterized protein n=1 Tax=Tritrichomonas foetus TaxID=1144522 RepID=A0A1J4KNB9_9EUKA|nr:hypothetical protein TRFO_17769 [Tritrichomonas foetus]|eukprot:OHT12400.1 hypothetical protein TRFO_17769 [Tritrichomonas foetus]